MDNAQGWHGQTTSDEAHACSQCHCHFWGKKKSSEVNKQNITTLRTEIASDSHVMCIKLTE